MHGSGCLIVFSDLGGREGGRGGGSSKTKILPYFTRKFSGMPVSNFWHIVCCYSGNHDAAFCRVFWRNDQSN